MLILVHCVYVFSLNCILLILKVDCSKETESCCVEGLIENKSQVTQLDTRLHAQDVKDTSRRTRTNEKQHSNKEENECWNSNCTNSLRTLLDKLVSIGSSNMHLEIYMNPDNKDIHDPLEFCP